MDISCGARHTLILTWNGDIYCCGDNANGQCGIEQNRTTKPALTLEGNKKIRARFIFAGETHSCMMVTSGDVFMFGDSTANRLGFYNHSNNVSQPTLVSKLLGKSIMQIGLGGQHSIVVLGNFERSLLNSKAN